MNLGEEDFGRWFYWKRTEEHCDLKLGCLVYWDGVLVGFSDNDRSSYKHLDHVVPLSQIMMFNFSTKGRSKLLD